MNKGHDVYVLLHPGYPHERAGIVPGLTVITYKSRTTVPELIKSNDKWVEHSL